ncbi:RsmB/NOP family class I SAM-dependent RNA methyltransferase [Parashewanella tropica]|uniref:RsmB/NOP family class I SAM-dependent RNA methyltransferase n=1 Tax=Parashewanella tropica TaxID=2547970 RepID=UPI0010593B42|nr:RsmB/NOP family class I SAM-dependent RNA methyltransferase [Parashewanella tropica]
MLKSSLNVKSSQLVVNVLKLVLEQGKPLDRGYSISFSEVKLKPEEQARITQVVGDLLRRLNLYCYLVNIQLQDAAKNAELLVVVWHEFNGLNSGKLPKASQFKRSEYQHLLTKAKQDEVLWDGCPGWLDKIGVEQLGESWKAERKALLQPAKRYLRANQLKTTRDQLKKALSKEGIETQIVNGVGSALEVTSNSPLFKSKAFKAGFFEQQDAGSQLVAAAVDAKPGMRVVDACAGAGGKTLHLAGQMQGKGRLLAMDVEQWKLDALKDRAKRAGAHNVETRIIASSKTIKRLKLTADRVLLDVPCSGLGVLKRNPDSKWRDTSERLPVLVKLQEDILQSYSRMVKVGGMLVYATCSIMPEENRQQVDKFLANNPHFEFIEDENITPANTGFDGFYLAKLKRVAE